MGRPRKQEAAYFYHYIQNPVVDILREVWGNDGYVFWYTLQELLCGSSGHYICIADKQNADRLAKAAAIDVGEINAMLKRLAEIGAIDSELYSKRQIIWCQSLVDSMKHIYSKRTTELPQKPPIEPEEEEREQYAEYVSMTADEYQKLLKKLGPKQTARAIEILDNHKGANGKSYESDYRAILGWVMDKLEEEKQRTRGGRKNSGREDGKKFREQSGTMRDSLGSAEAWFKDEKPATGKQEV